MGKNTFDVLMFAISCIALAKRFAWLAGSDQNRQRVKLLATLLWCIRPADMQGVVDGDVLGCTRLLKKHKLAKCVFALIQYQITTTRHEEGRFLTCKAY